ncbi:hypothetical protein LJK88_09265 [Paenibacillus sp. P26]|nr:hypothetical protein LJK88_09265 [Paenibacillus sp. P26]UUZ89927.1 hypothetical protein LJK87_28325 [Paenibacillus sp. P25]
MKQKDKEEVVAVVNNFVNAYNNRNVDEMKSIYHESSPEFNVSDMREFLKHEDSKLNITNIQIIDIFEERAEINVITKKKSSDGFEKNVELTFYIRKYAGESHWKLYDTLLHE